MRRSKGHAQSVIRTGDITVNLDAKTVEVNGIRVHLTGKEYQMLELLSLSKGTTLTKEMFLNHLYGGMDEPELKIIDVFICKLRKKLAAAANGKHHIENRLEAYAATCCATRKRASSPQPSAAHPPAISFELLPSPATRGRCSFRRTLCAPLARRRDPGQAAIRRRRSWTARAAVELGGV